MKEYEVVDTHADNIGSCVICGRNPGRTEGYRNRICRIRLWEKTIGEISSAPSATN